MSNSETAGQLLPVEIQVEVGDDRNDRRWTETFMGRWLITPDDSNRFGPDAGACYGIAGTASGNIAVYCYHINDRFAPGLKVYDDIAQAVANEPWSEEAEAMILSAAGDGTVRRNI